MVNDMGKGRTSAGAEIIEKILKQRRIKKVDLAKLVGKSPAGLSSWLNKSLRFDELVAVANYYGYDVTIHPSASDKGTLGFQDLDICENCRYKKFSDTIENALDRLKSRHDAAGTIIDFYSDDDDDSDGEYFHEETEI